MSAIMSIKVTGLEESIAFVAKLSANSKVKWRKQSLDSGARALKDSLAEEAPDQTGRLVRSIMWTGSGDRRTIAITAPYARRIVQGTSPSPGRYVPALGRRLKSGSGRKIGMHPGTRANDFVSRGVAKAEERIGNEAFLVISKDVQSL